MHTNHLVVDESEVLRDTADGAALTVEAGAEGVDRVVPADAVAVALGAALSVCRS